MAKSTKPGARVDASTDPSESSTPAGPFMPVDVGGGQVVNVPVCWSPEKTASYLKRWPGGVIILTELRAVPAADTMGRGTHQERCWIAARALELAGKAPNVHQFRAGIIARMQLLPAVALPARQHRRT